MKKAVKIISLMLCFCMALTFVFPANAAYDPSSAGRVADEAHSQSKFNKGFWNFTEVLLDGLATVVTSLMPDQTNWVKKSDYVSKNVPGGDETFLETPAEGAVWKAGFASASLLEGQNVLDGNHYVGGTLAFTKKVATEVEDDLKVRTVALDDGSGRGSVVFAVIDGFGLSAKDVREIRERMADYCAEMNVKSLNVSVLHQHSAVDTLGLNGDFWRALFVSPWQHLFRKQSESGQNKEYMENLYAKTQQTVKQAVEGMREGKLYYGKASLAEYVTDKRDPQMLDEYFERFRFVPNDGSRELWLATSCIHCVGNGAGGTLITGDYPYYMEQVINDEYGADFALILGAEQGTSQDKSTVAVETDTRLEDTKRLGAVLANRLASIENETEVEPILNIRHKEVFFDISNKVLVLAGKGGLTTNIIVKSGLGKYQEVSEIGYMEIGKDVAVALVPGEAAAELFYGGAAPADKSWSGKAWDYAPLSESANGRELIVFGLMNDMTGYIIPDNDYMPILFPENSSLEIVALGGNVASTMTEALAELMTK